MVASAVQWCELPEGSLASSVINCALLYLKQIVFMGINGFYFRKVFSQQQNSSSHTFGIRHSLSLGCLMERLLLFPSVSLRMFGMDSIKH